MIKPLLALCDTDETYLGRLYEYLKENLKLSFEIAVFSAISPLMEFAKENKVALLVISENALWDLKTEAKAFGFSNILVLDEEANLVMEDETTDGSCLMHASKYQPAKGIVDSIVEFCAERADDFEGVGCEFVSEEGKVIGLFTPLARAGQTSLALKMGEVLSRKARTIFLSFESFSTLPRTLGLDKEGTIADLMYYAECEESKFTLHLEKIKNTVGNLDVIAPAKTAMQLKEISYDNLKKLVNLLVKESGYEYVVLDLKDYPEGFFDILRLCNKLFTIVRPTEADAYKQELFEDVLRENGYEDVIADLTKVNVADLKDSRLMTNTAMTLLKKEGVIIE